MNNSKQSNAAMPSREDEAIVLKRELQRLSKLPIFQDICFNCKDGKVFGNRLTICIYSEHMEKIFMDNPLLIRITDIDVPDEGINLPENNVRDVKLLLNAVSTVSAVYLNSDELSGIINAALTLKMKFNQSQTSNGFTRFELIPKALWKSDNNGNNNEMRIFKPSVDLSFNGDYDDSLGREDDELVASAFLDSDMESESSISSVDVKPDLSKLAINMRKRVKVEDPDWSPYGSKPFKAKVKTEPIENSHEGYLAVDYLDDENGEDSEKPKVCPFCNITCKSWKGMRTHIGHSHSGTRIATPRNNFKCKCGKEYSLRSRDRFNAHKKECSDYLATAFRCEVCDDPFQELPALNAHRHMVHGIAYKSNSCLCGQVFRNSADRRSHSIKCSVYNEAAVFHCTDCDLPFLSNNHFQQHLRSVDHKTVEMELILRGEKDPKDIQMVEIREKQMQVCKCGEAFAYNYRYREHRNNCEIFKKEAAICDICQDAFKDEKALGIHKKMAHGTIRNKCRCSCGLEFNNRCDRKLHQAICETYRKQSAADQIIDTPSRKRGRKRKFTTSAVAANSETVPSENLVVNNVSLNSSHSSIPEANATSDNC
ncbi:protein suppressor of hairy wing-like protein [Leptotrombidium deliense]|uniref:Protein suppressor of hairy wing-like protein n=1 Tax=Leptotrombidium deliense TaxID=299467 RepID=A0A443SHF2_9ACAR|nr:protein suppressor of hairy wing-like protein [Leptotrombidium deliense]